MIAPVPGRPLRLAHRGDHRHAPENSLAAFGAALRVAACDGLEFDVRLSHDGVPIVLHDPSLERVQGVAALAADLSAAELDDRGVPSLAAVLAATPHRAFLDVELKVPIGQALIAVLAAARGPELGHAVLSSFDPEALERVRGLAPGWPTWLNAEDLEPSTIDLARRLGCVGISADARAIDPRSAGAVARAGLALAAWTVRRRATFIRLARLGVVAVCVEGPALDG